jgi:cold shock CspA family protein
MAETQQDVVQGVVSAYDVSRGFGFIATDEMSLFFHAREVQGGFILRKGDRVQFTVTESRKHTGKFECISVLLLERASAGVRQ